MNVASTMYVHSKNTFIAPINKTDNILEDIKDFTIVDFVLLWVWTSINVFETYVLHKSGYKV